MKKSLNTLCTSCFVLRGAAYKHKHLSSPKLTMNFFDIKLLLLVFVSITYVHAFGFGQPAFNQGPLDYGHFFGSPGMHGGHMTHLQHGGYGGYGGYGGHGAHVPHVSHMPAMPAMHSMHSMQGHAFPGQQWGIPAYQPFGGFGFQPSDNPFDEGFLFADSPKPPKPTEGPAEVVQAAETTAPEQPAPEISEVQQAEIPEEVQPQPEFKTEIPYEELKTEVLQAAEQAQGELPQPEGMQSEGMQTEGLQSEGMQSSEQLSEQPHANGHVNGAVNGAANGADVVVNDAEQQQLAEIPPLQEPEQLLQNAEVQPEQVLTEQGEQANEVSADKTARFDPYGFESFGGPVMSGWPQVYYGEAENGDNGHHGKTERHHAEHGHNGKNGAHAAESHHPGGESVKKGGRSLFLSGGVQTPAYALGHLSPGHLSSAHLSSAHHLPLAPRGGGYLYRGRRYKLLFHNGRLSILSDGSDHAHHTGSQAPLGLWSRK